LVNSEKARSYKMHRIASPPTAGYKKPIHLGQEDTVHTMRGPQEMEHMLVDPNTSSRGKNVTSLLGS
jgi:hypothetical protein